MCMATTTMIADIATKTGVMVLREISSIRHRKPDERLGGIVTRFLERNDVLITSSRNLNSRLLQDFSGGG